MKKLKLNKEKSNFKLLSGAFYIGLLLTGKSVYCMNNNNFIVKNNPFGYQDSLNSNLTKSIHESIISENELKLEVKLENKNSSLLVNNSDISRPNISSINEQDAIHGISFNQVYANEEFSISKDSEAYKAIEFIKKWGDPYSPINNTHKKIIYKLGTKDNQNARHHYVAAEVFRLYNQTIVIHRDILTGKLNQEFIDYVTKYIDNSAIIANINYGNEVQNLDFDIEDHLKQLMNTLQNNEGDINNARMDMVGEDNLESALGAIDNFANIIDFRR